MNAARAKALGFSICVVLAGLVLRAAFFAVSVSNVPISADESLAVLQAKKIAAGERPLLLPGQPYVFPVESYFLAPFVERLPRNALGTRLPILVAGLASFVASLWIASRLGDPSRTWPAILLLSLPSGYWLIFQSAYAPSPYAAFHVMTWLAIALGCKAAARPADAVLAFLIGLLGGLSFSAHTLSVCVVAVVGVWICLGGSPKRACIHVAGYVPGLAVGLTPYLLVEHMVPGAHGVVAGRRRLAEALAMIWNPGLTHSVPSVLGVSPIAFPDSDLGSNVSVLPAFLVPCFGVLYAGLLLAVAIDRTRAFFGRLRRSWWPSLEVSDMFVGASAACLALFLLSERSHSHTYRYLLPLAWFEPFLVSALYGSSPRRLRVAIGALALVLAGLNLATSARLIQRWAEPDFALAEANMAELRPAMDFFAETGIRHCYAEYWLAYRITVESEGAVTCSQPYNERFPGWPLPYKDEVDASTDAVYVFSRWLDRASAHPSRMFQQELSSMHVSYERETRGDFRIYWRYRSADSESEARIPAAELSVKVSHDPPAARFLTDGDPTSRWRSRRSQEKGMWIEVGMGRARILRRLSLRYDGYAFDQAASVNVLARTLGGWQPLRIDVAAELDPFTFAGGHPVYGVETQTFRLPPTSTDALRIEIARSSPGRDWTIGEIEAYEGSAASW